MEAEPASAAHASERVHRVIGAGGLHTLVSPSHASPQSYRTLERHTCTQGEFWKTPRRWVSLPSIWSDGASHACREEAYSRHNTRHGARGTRFFEALEVSLCVSVGDQWSSHGPSDTTRPSLISVVRSPTLHATLSRQSSWTPRACEPDARRISSSDHAIEKWARRSA